ncbi:rCG63237 [Rattus norvegicus]|uniref:RCG63237 n=1 Tax=Rattus norvegicus TaxID=10116 RepID=A6JUB7_RAT|nr:rCG63237 [Rattus norvegicus]
MPSCLHSEFQDHQDNLSQNKQKWICYANPLQPCKGICTLFVKVTTCARESGRDA